MPRAYQRRVTALLHFRKEMSHSVSRLVRHNLPITSTRHTRGISRGARSPAAYDITRSKHRVPFAHSSRLRSTHFDPLIKTMARIAEQNKKIHKVLPTVKTEAEQIDEIAKIRGWFLPKQDSAYYPLIQQFLNEQIDAKEATSRILGPIDDKIKDAKLDDVDFMDLWKSIIHSAKRSTFRGSTQVNHKMLVELLSTFKEHAVPGNEQYNYVYQEMTDFGMACREALNDSPVAHHGYIDQEIGAWANTNFFFALVTAEKIQDLSMFALFAFREALETPAIDDPMSTANQKYDANVPAAAAWILGCGHDLFRLEKDLTPSDRKQGNPGRGGELWKGKAEFSKERWAFWKERFAAIAEMEGVSEDTRIHAKDAIEGMERSQTFTFAEEIRKEGDIERVGGGFYPSGQGAQPQKKDMPVDPNAKHGGNIITP